MFDDDAEDSAARAERGRENQAFRDFHDSVKLDIKEQADFGLNSTKYKVSQADRKFVDAMIERLTEAEYQVEWVEPNLIIKW